MAPKTILEKIMRWKREELPRHMRERPLVDIKAGMMLAPPVRPLVPVLKRSEAGIPALIAEVKRASPVKGLLRNNFNAVEIAATYIAEGAAALSVLTDAHFFQGNIEVFRAVRNMVRRPMLRKDFIFDPYQVYEARAIGADALLLIVGVLSDRELANLTALTRELGMEVLIEVHDEEELQRALAVKPAIIGVNNRDLRSFEVDFNTTLRLRAAIPEGITVVSESGIRTAADVRTLGEGGVDAVLVGETLVRAKDIGAKVRELVRGTTGSQRGNA